MDGFGNLINGFKEQYGHEPACFARAPGRINLIGEHIDYSNCPVLPAAVDREIIAAAAAGGDTKVRVSVLSGDFSSRSFSLETSLPPFETGDWGNYVKGGIQGILDYFTARGKKIEDFSGIEVVIDGNIPIAAGMSSSSALVVLSALIFLQANSLSIEKLELAELLAGAEHYVGTRGGGMDQAAILFGRENHAVFINFNPLAVEYVPLPEGYTFIVADSTIKAPKTKAALDKYNRRTIECRIGTTIIREKMEKIYRRDIPLRVLGDLTPEKLGISAGEIGEVTGNLFHSESYPLQEIASILGKTESDTAREYCLRKDGTIFPEPKDGFKLKQRFTHVMEEWKRVLDSAEVLRRGDMQAFGELMNKSHGSCRDLYEISIQELDVLVDMFRSAGALGSRLTGAGFGGCAVSLVRQEDVPRIVKEVAERYYSEYLQRRDTDLSNLLFPCKIVDGAKTMERRDG